MAQHLQARGGVICRKTRPFPEIAYKLNGSVQNEVEYHNNVDRVSKNVGRKPQSFNQSCVVTHKFVFALFRTQKLQSHSFHSKALLSHFLYLTFFAPLF